MTNPAAPNPPPPPTPALATPPTAPAPPRPLEARGASFHFRAGRSRVVRAVDEVSLAVAAGEAVALSGPSGSGKSTLLSLLGALRRPTAGEVLVCGRAVARASDVELARVRRRVGIVFQHAALLPRLPAWENVTCGLIPRGVSRRARYARAADLLARFGLAGEIDRRPDQLSGGQQQRVALARALAGDPEVLLLDEPTSQLDPAAAAAVATALAGLAAAGHTLVIATHDPLLLSVATRVIRLADGRIVNETPPAGG
jgi:ABC-type lipoprotein export system ATPase subunit